MAIGAMIDMVGSFAKMVLPGKERADLSLSLARKFVGMDEPASAPAATATLSPQARAAQLEAAQSKWDQSIQAGLTNPQSAPEVRAAMREAMQKTEQQAAQAAQTGRTFDKDAALAGNLAEASLARSEKLGDGPARSSLLNIFDGSVGFINERSAQNGGK